MPSAMNVTINVQKKKKQNEKRIKMHVSNKNPQKSKVK